MCRLLSLSILFAASAPALAEPIISSEPGSLSLLAAAAAAMLIAWRRKE